MNKYYEFFIEEVCRIKLTTLDDIYKFNKELNKWKYGILINGKIYTKCSEIDWSKYKTIRISDIEKYHVGICWDFVNYQHYYFKKNNIKDESYFFVMQQSEDENDIVTHTFSIFTIANKKYWFESSWFGHQGVKEISSFKDVVLKLVEKYGDHAYSVYKYNPDGLDNNISNGDFFKRTTRNLVFNKE